MSLVHTDTMSFYCCCVEYVINFHWCWFQDGSCLTEFCTISPDTFSFIIWRSRVCEAKQCWPQPAVYWTQVVGLLWHPTTLGCVSSQFASWLLTDVVFELHWSIRWQQQSHWRPEFPAASQFVWCRRSASLQLSARWLPRAYIQFPDHQWAWCSCTGRCFITTGIVKSTSHHCRLFVLYMPMYALLKLLMFLFIVIHIMVMFAFIK